MQKKLLLGVQFVCVLLICINLLIPVLSRKDKFFVFDYWKRFPQLEKIYKDSQYVNKHPLGWAPDEVINAYAGGAYIQGVGPHLIAPDTPPLGRYLIGVSAVVFHNENIIVLLFSIFSLLGLYFLGMQIFSYRLTALLAILLVSFEPFFKNQLVYTPLLDIMQLAFLIFSFYFFNKGSSKKEPLAFYSVGGLLLGCFMATKFFITGFVVLGTWVLSLLLRKQYKKLLQICTSFLISIGVLLLSYVRVFAYRYSLKSFLGIQKWVFLYHKSQLILPFSIWPLIYLNKWYVWFGNKPVLSDSQWLITWPLGLTIAFVSIGLYAFGKINKRPAVEPLMLWVVLYIAFFSFGQITSRYLIIYLPIVYLVAFFGVEKCTIFITKRYENRH